MLSIFCVVSATTSGPTALALKATCVAVAVFLFLHYCVTMGTAICDAIGIKFFTIKPSAA